jgi:mannose-6-phosphate isomerase-like protein (cupin superfamily)
MPAEWKGIYATILLKAHPIYLLKQEETLMTGFVGKLEILTIKNKYFRKVLFTGKHAQLVVMCLKPGEEIGNEVHRNVDQFFRIEEGDAKFVFGGKETHTVHASDAVVVPAGTYHNVINTSKTKQLKLYTVYSPPNHPDGTIHKTKAEAEEAEKKAHR